MKAKTGACEGRKAYGTRAGEAEVVIRIVEWRQAGAAMDAIAHKLNAEGVKPRSGNRWYGSTIRNILQRAAPEDPASRRQE
jgi:hypothetical protein